MVGYWVLLVIVFHEFSPYFRLWHLKRHLHVSLSVVLSSLFIFTYIDIIVNNEISLKNIIQEKIKKENREKKFPKKSGSVTFLRLWTVWNTTKARLNAKVKFVPYHKGQVKTATRFYYLKHKWWLVQGVNIQDCDPPGWVSGHVSGGKCLCVINNLV